MSCAAILSGWSCVGVPCNSLLLLVTPPCPATQNDLLIVMFRRQNWYKPLNALYAQPAFHFQPGQANLKFVRYSGHEPETVSGNHHGANVPPSQSVLSADRRAMVSWETLIINRYPSRGSYASSPELGFLPSGVRDIVSPLAKCMPQLQLHFFLVVHLNPPMRQNQAKRTGWGVLHRGLEGN